MRLLKLSRVSELLAGKNYAPDIFVTGYCVDSRSVKKGDVYFALKGANLDGHDFLDEVRQKGAVAAVVAKDCDKHFDDFFLFRVDDTLDALQKLAKSVLEDSSARIVAITGSVGKTTTKEFLRTLLEGHFSVSASPGNHNSQIGLPLSILNHTSGREEVIILEMGMTHPGQISKLVEIAPPEVSLLTSVALVHACNFDSIEEIAKTKAEIFNHPRTKLGILHRDIPNYPEIIASSKCFKQSFSLTSPFADYTSEPCGTSGLFCKADNRIIKTDLFTLPGKHNRHNLLAAIAVARYFKISPEEIQERLKELSLPERRLQYLEKNGVLFINDAYNASELSVKSALESLPCPKEAGKKIAVLGSMMELGKFSDGCHRRVGEHALNFVDQCYCLGEECLPIFDIWKKAGREVELFNEFPDLMSCLKKHLRRGDVVLIKGSYSKQMWKIIDEY